MSIPKPLRIQNTYLTHTDRLNVAARACAWAGEMAEAEAAAVVELAGGYLSAEVQAGLDAFPGETP